MPPSWREAIIAVLSKGGKDRQECCNFRPISVLYQDYKLFTSILAKRPKTILPDIISLDQTGFIRQRRTRDSIRHTPHVINHIQRSNRKALVVGLDTEKAFDSVEWSFSCTECCCLLISMKNLLRRFKHYMTNQRQTP